MPSFTRAAFEKTCLAEVGGLLKGSRWKRKLNSAFLQEGDFFFVATISVYRNAARSVAELQLKPMNVDPLLWDILRMPENAREPLSFRAWGAFTCPAIPVADAELESDGSTPIEVAQAFKSFIDQSVGRAQQELERRPFLQALRTSKNHIERGSYAVTEVTVLLLQAQYQEAAALASEYASGRKTSAYGLESNGSSFHRLALEWLAARKCLQ